MESQYIYSERAVAFLDVLGFQNKLSEFENQAIEFSDNFIPNPEAEDFADDANNGLVYFSQKANEFIGTFNSAITKLDKDKFNYFLFSDNICITAAYVKDNDENSSLIELLLVISELYFEFVQKGYFLRGGIDYGWFIDKSSIAIGVPLATAYKLESTQAVFPRIVLSDKFIKQLENDPSERESKLSYFESSLIMQSCEVKYLNVFIHLFKVEDKEYFFERYSNNISENLNLNSKCENIYNKFKWLADEFNSFIETYTNSLAYFDENFEVTDEFIKKVKQLKINYGH